MIPHTELLMAEQWSIVFQALKSVYTIKECFWIDSAVVYSWILNKTKKYDAYTDKRLQTIRSAIKDTGELKLVPSKLNPADIGTRGMSPKTLVENKSIWFSVPQFFRTNREILAQSGYWRQFCGFSERQLC